MMTGQMEAVGELSSRIKRQLADLLKSADTGPVSEAAALKRSHGKLTRDYDRLEKGYDLIASQAKAKAKDSVPTVAPAFVPYSEDGDEGGDGRSAGQIQNQLIFNDSIIAEREQDIGKIAKEVKEVNEIFKDLAGMVNDQGEDINNIEEMIGSSNASAAQGLKEVEKAAEYQPKCTIQ
jgi:syntaxin 7